MRYLELWTEYKALFVSLHLIIAAMIFSGWITGNKPIVCKYKGNWYLPVLFSDRNQSSDLATDLQSIGQMDYQKLNYDFSIWPLFDMDPSDLNASDAWLQPGTIGGKGTYYFLGSFDLGRDLFSACIHGLNKSLWLALITMLMASAAGILTGSLAVYQSQRLPRISVWSGIMIATSCILLVFMIYLYVEFRFITEIHWILFVVIIFLIILALLLYDYKPQRFFSLDRISLAYVEIMKSIPTLLFLLIMVQMFLKPGTLALSFIIAFLYAPVIVKYSRTFTYKMISKPFLDALAVSGAGPARIFLKHILPKVALDMIPVMVFGLAQIILLESSLSFLGLGLPLDSVSLGNIMNSARTNPSAWWAILFPGLLLFWIVVTLNGFGEWLNKRKAEVWIQEISPHA